jgi:hypothetical protein
MRRKWLVRDRVEAESERARNASSSKGSGDGVRRGMRGALTRCVGLKVPFMSSRDGAGRCDQLAVVTTDLVDTPLRLLI